MTGPEVAVGQVWRSRDKRDGGKTVTVEELCVHGYVVVRSMRKSRILRNYFVQRYELVRDVPAP